MTWQQIYDPFHNMIISTALAAIPVVVMLVCLGFLHVKAHIAAGLGLIAALIVAVFAYGMPADMAGRAALFGGFTGLLPIGWIVLNIIFLYQLVEGGADKSFGETPDTALVLLCTPWPALPHHSLKAIAEESFAETFSVSAGSSRA